MKAKRPTAKSEIGATHAQIKSNYLRLCEKYGWKKPCKWSSKMSNAQKGNHE